MKKLFAVLMALVMVVSVFSVVAFATEGEGDDEGTTSSAVSSENEDDNETSSTVTDEGDDTSSDVTSEPVTEPTPAPTEGTGDDDVDPGFTFPFVMEHVAYVAGRGNNKVAPNADLTRAEAAMMLYRLLNDDVRDKYMGDEIGFSDVSLDAWYADAVKCLAGMGLVKGYPENKFKPNDKITRGELVVMMARVLDEDADKGEGFVDTVPDWAEDDVLRAQAAGIVVGYPDGTFQFNRNVSRAETITMINRLFGRNCYEGTDAESGFDDLSPNHWAYDAIMEATQEHEAAMDEWSEDIL